MQLRYNYRLDPTPGQIRCLARAFGCARVVWNDAVAARKAAFVAGLPFPMSSCLAKTLITEAKRTDRRKFLGEVSHAMLQASLRDLDSAYRNYFDSRSGKRAGKAISEPRFKSRKDGRQTVRFCANSRFRVTDAGALRLPKIGDVKVRWSRLLPSLPSSVTVIRDASGRFFASFVVVTDPAEDLDRFPSAELETGIDLGLTHFAVLSDGKKIDAPKFLRKAEKKLKKLQQDLSRKQKGSNNRTKARLKVAKAHAHVANARRDFHHKLSTTLIRENQAVYVEDLAVAAMARSRMRGRSKAVHDVGWSQFADLLEYKAARYGRSFAKVDRFAPTSQVCSACGVKDGPKPLNVREWTCGGCGTVHDRDVNAAKNILALGRRERLNACGAQVRPGLVPAQRDEAGTHRSDHALVGATQ